MTERIEVENLPQAHRVSVYYCENDPQGPPCGNPHVVLRDATGEPFAQFVQTPEFFVGILVKHAEREGSIELLREYAEQLLEGSPFVIIRSGRRQ